MVVPVKVTASPEVGERIIRNLIAAGYIEDVKKPGAAESSSMTPAPGRVATAKAV